MTSLITIPSIFFDLTLDNFYIIITYYKHDVLNETEGTANYRYYELYQQSPRYKWSD